MKEELSIKETTAILNQHCEEHPENMETSKKIELPDNIEELRELQLKAQEELLKPVVYT